MPDIVTESETEAEHDPVTLTKPMTMKLCSIVEITFFGLTIPP